MRRRPRTSPLFPTTTLFRSLPAYCPGGRPPLFWPGSIGTSLPASAEAGHSVYSAFPLRWNHHRLVPYIVSLQNPRLSRGLKYLDNRRVFDRWLSRKPQPLTGAPAIRRQKTYSGQSGYVYQYYYEGHRPYKRDRNSGTEHVFDVSADRKTSIAVSVLVSDAAVEDWESRHGRTLYASERYAIAKMALFQAFDERPNPAAMSADVHVRAADVEAILITLEIE